MCVPPQFNRLHLTFPTKCKHIQQSCPCCTVNFANGPVMKSSPPTAFGVSLGFARKPGTSSGRPPNRFSQIPSLFQDFSEYFDGSPRTSQKKDVQRLELWLLSRSLPPNLGNQVGGSRCAETPLAPAARREGPSRTPHSPASLSGISSRLTEFPTTSSTFSDAWNSPMIPGSPVFPG